MGGKVLTKDSQKLYILREYLSVIGSPDKQASARLDFSRSLHRADQGVSEYIVRGVLCDHVAARDAATALICRRLIYIDSRLVFDIPLG